MMRLAMLEADATAYDTDACAAVTTDETRWRLWATGDTETVRAVWGAFAGEHCVGLVAAHRENGDCHIGALWVQPEHRGAGCSRLLLDAAETWAHDVRCTRVVLGVADWNPARAYYERRHYALTGATTRTRWGHLELEMAKPAGV